MNPCKMVCTRVAHVEVIGQLWEGGQGQAVYQLTDQDLMDIDKWTVNNILLWLKRNGDFQKIIYFYLVCGENCFEWEDEALES